MTAEPTAARGSSTCWCGGKLGRPIGVAYRQCVECGTVVLAVKPEAPHFDVTDDAVDFYGKTYWTEYPRTRSFPDIDERARTDLSERCVFWLERLLEVVQPPGRTLEIGCGHGGFVRLMRELGFDATGTELSPWVVDYARRTFEVSVLQGRLEALALEPGFACIAAFDVLEHLQDPLDTVRRCGGLLAPDGVLLLQTPCYRGEGPEWTMLQADEHVHLFTEESVRWLLDRAGFREVRIQSSLFPYDMWVAATPGRLGRGAGAADSLPGGWRLPTAFRALLDLAPRLKDTSVELSRVEAERAIRSGQVEEIVASYRKLEADAAARLGQIHTLTAGLRESEADRAARLEQIHTLTEWLRQSQAEGAAQQETIRGLQAQVETLHAEAETLHAEAETLQAQAETLQAQAETLQARLERIERSAVWRIYRAIASRVTPTGSS